MASKLVELGDGVLVEVEAPEGEAVPMTVGFVTKVENSLDKVSPMLVAVCKPFARACRELGKDLKAERVEIEFGLGIEGEGNIFITKSKGQANLIAKLVLVQPFEVLPDE